MMLQVALLLLSCGLSLYVWSINTSVARVVISLTTLVGASYLVIVVAGASSYDCPFQTPVSIALRALRHNEGVQKLLTTISPPTVIAYLQIACINTRNHVVLALRWLRGSIRGLVTNFSPSAAVSGIQRGGRTLGHGVIISLHLLDHGFQNLKMKLVQVLGLKPIRLPVHVDDPDRQPPPETTLQLVPASIDTLSENNSNDARCVCWILWNITDPEAIDSAIQLAGMIRWFEDCTDIDPPYNLIVTVFNSCFDSSWDLHPGMRDRAYSSARARLAIYVSALANCPERASEYSFRDYRIPIQSHHQDPDLESILRIFWNLSYNYPPFQDFVRPRNTSAHTLWMTDVYLRYIWSQRDGLTPHFHGLLTSSKVEYEDWNTFPTAAVSNLILVRSMFLGSSVEGKVLHMVDKS